MPEDNTLKVGMIIRSPTEDSRGCYLVINPGETHSLVLDLFEMNKDDLLNIVMTDMGYTDEFIGSFRSTQETEYTFIPTLRPVPNTFLQDPENDLVCTLTNKDMRILSVRLLCILWSENPQKDPKWAKKHPNGWWTLKRKQEFLEDFKFMSPEELGQKWDVSPNRVKALKTLFSHDVEPNHTGGLKNDAESDDNRGDQGEGRQLLQ